MGRQELSQEGKDETMTGLTAGWQKARMAKSAKSLQTDYLAAQSTVKDSSDIRLHVVLPLDECLLLAKTNEGMRNVAMKHSKPTPV